MPKISNKKKKFIKKNFKSLSIEDLVSRTGLKADVVRSLVDEYSKDRFAQTEKRTGIVLSLKTILFVSLLFSTIAMVIYSPSLKGEFVFDDVSIRDRPFYHITELSKTLELLFTKDIGRKVGIMKWTPSQGQFFPKLRCASFCLLTGLFILPFWQLSLPNTPLRVFCL